MLTSRERIQKDIENLSKCNATPDKGLTRFSFTKEDKCAREYIKSALKEAGARVYEDAAGTVIGRIEGEVKDAPCIMVGSHFDSVRHGGNFDGPAGVVTAIEIARTIKENNIKLEYPIEFIGFIEEEGARFGGGLFGSRAMAGLVSRESLDEFKDDEGVSMAKAMEDFGFNPDKINEAKRDSKDIKAFLELHIEQGPILENNNTDIGIVNYIVGIKQIEITFKGRADHAGTTPMDMRIDALDAASKLISEISDFAKSTSNSTVATVGTLKLSPGSANIVPNEVTFTVDIRSDKKDSINQVLNKIKTKALEVSKEKNVSYDLEDKLNVDPIKLSEDIYNLFQKECNDLGFTNRIMVSGAGHDAMIMASLTEVGLLFVPSVDGRSHSPDEWTDYDKLHKGVEVVFQTILKLGKVVK